MSDKTTVQSCGEVLDQGCVIVAGMRRSDHSTNIGSKRENGQCAPAIFFFIPSKRLYSSPQER